MFKVANVASLSLASLYNGLIGNGHIVDDYTTISNKVVGLTSVRSDVLDAFALSKRSAGNTITRESLKHSASVYSKSLSMKLPETIVLKLYYSVFGIDPEIGVCPETGPYSWLSSFPKEKWPQLVLEFGPEGLGSNWLSKLKSVCGDASEFSSGSVAKSVIGGAMKLVPDTDMSVTTSDDGSVVCSIRTGTFVRNIRVGAGSSSFVDQWRMVYNSMMYVPSVRKKLLLFFRNIMSRDYFITGNRAAGIYNIPEDLLGDYLVTRYKADDVLNPYPYGYCWNNGFMTIIHLDNMKQYKPVMELMEVAEVAKKNYEYYTGGFSLHYGNALFGHFYPARSGNIPFASLLLASSAQSSWKSMLPEDIDTFKGKFRFISRVVSEPQYALKFTKETNVVLETLAFALRDQNGGRLTSDVTPVA